jgi:hypothetical protein
MASCFGAEIAAALGAQPQFFSRKLAILGKASVFVSGIVPQLDYIEECTLVLVLNRCCRSVTTNFSLSSEKKHKIA